MFHHFIFVKRLAQKLNEVLQEASLETCFSQNKNELVIGFTTRHSDDFYINAKLQPEVSLLTFPSTFNRAKKNSINIFSELIGSEVIRVIEVPFDRSFYIELKGHRKLLFKLHGSRSNVIHFHDNKLVEVFNSSLKKDLSLTFSDLGKSFDLESDFPVDDFEKIIGKVYLKRLNVNEDYDGLSNEEKRLKLNSVVAEMWNSEFGLITGAKPDINLMPPPSGFRTFDPLEICDKLHTELVTKYLFQKEKDSKTQALKKEVSKTLRYIEVAQEKHQKLTSTANYKQTADVIIANLHLIDHGSKEVELFDFYENKMVTIKLKPTLSPQKLAESYYRKGKNQHKEKAVLDKNLAAKKFRINELKEQIASVEEISDWKTLNALKKRTETKIEVSLFPVINYLGYEILIGRDGKKNDLLTFKTAKKEDLWLHARGVPGSHVLVKNPSKKTIPKPVLEKAAGVAAYHSKLKNDTTAPVIFTPRKYVRKPKGFPPGKVIVDKEEVILVTPDKGF